MRARAEELVEAAPATAWAGRNASAGVVGDRVYSVATAMQSFNYALVRALGRPPKSKNNSDIVPNDTTPETVSTTQEA
jgi:hypothetical protein